MTTDTQINARATPEQKAAWAAAAKADGRTLAGWIRARLDEAARKAQPPVTP